MSTKGMRQPFWVVNANDAYHVRTWGENKQRVTCCIFDSQRDAIRVSRDANASFQREKYGFVDPHSGLRP